MPRRVAKQALSLGVAIAAGLIVAGLPAVPTQAAGTAGVVTVLGANTSDPQGITLGPDGALWFTNSDNSIGRIAPSGAVTILKNRSLHGPQGMVTGPDGALWFTNFDNDSIGRVTTAGKVSTFSLGSIVGFAVPDPNDITVASVVTEPEQGGGGPVAVSGGGFSAREPGSVKYLTGSSPASVALCSTTATPTGSFTCGGNIPTTAGNPGTHVIEAIGGTSHTKTKTTFLLVG